MRVLIIGSGGREHALTWALDKSPRVKELFVATGNGGTSGIAENIAIPVGDLDALTKFAVDRDIDLTVVGPEAPLVDGIVDRFKAADRRCFGPSRGAAQLEGSKVFSKEFMARHGIPTADFVVCDDAEAAKARVREQGAPIVVKADGLAAGKGAIVASTVEKAIQAIDDIMVARQFGDAGNRVVIESCLEGQEVSVHAICGGGKAILLPSSQDHKRIFDDDKGPNTGGMGAYAPVPFVDDDFRKHVFETVIMPTVEGMAAEGNPFDGVLYAGLMVTSEGAKVLEYNVRFGDPETQVLLPLIKSDLFDILYESAGGNLPADVEFYSDRLAAAVVVASGGYPGSYEKGFGIEGLDEVDDPDRVVFHAGTAVEGDGFVTTGGRVLAVTAWGNDLSRALGHAYQGIDKIKFDGAFWRKDIGRRAL